MMQRDPVSKLCDVYSYGIFVWELVTWKQPFSDVFPPFMVMTKVAAGEVRRCYNSKCSHIYLCISIRFICHTLIVSGATICGVRCNCKSDIIMAFFDSI